MTVKDGIVVQSAGFEKYLPVGGPEIAVEFLNQWGVDEIVYNDISATKEERGIDLDLIKSVSKKCFTPLMVGGGIKSVKDASDCIKSGADKVLVNNLLHTDSKEVSDMVQEFGSQCVIASLDMKRDQNGKIRPFNYVDKSFLPHDFLDLVKIVEELGVGEILINSVDRDGAYNGFEIDTLKRVKEHVSIPIIALGGAKSANCFQELFKETEVEAGAAANFFHFSEHSVTLIKSQLKKLRPNIRLDTEFDYGTSSFDENGRLVKRLDEDLENLLYIEIKDEIINKFEKD